MFLLDTNTISEMRKARMPRGNAGVAAWAASVDVEDLYLSAITLQELEYGVLRAERKDTRKGHILRNWMTGYVLKHFRDRILPVDTSIAFRSAQLHVQRTRPLPDALIAATAYVYRFSVVTRNVLDFDDTGVNVINPWEPSAT